MPEQNTLRLPPICECNNMACCLSLGISWDEYEIAHPKGVLLASNCESSFLGKVIEGHATYLIIQPYDGQAATNPAKSKSPNDLALDALRIISPAQLRLLADHMDVYDELRRAHGLSVSGTQVQDDLRRMANAAQAALDAEANNA